MHRFARILDRGKERIDASLSAVERVTLIRFLFGMRPY